MATLIGTQLKNVLPAYAGMIPWRAGPCVWRGCAPRVCGDDPRDQGRRRYPRPVLPAYAGMIRDARLAARERLRAPRVCGDDPKPANADYAVTMCSPPMRG